jgi:hypothetical protein
MCRYTEASRTRNSILAELFEDQPGEIFGDLPRGRVVPRLDHHPDQRLCARGPDEHSTIAAQPAASVLDLQPDSL